MFITALALAAAAPDPRFAGLRQKIQERCKGSAACVEKQNAGVKQFLGVMTLYTVPDAVSMRCMRTGMVNKNPDWTRAGPCMRAWSRTQKSKLAR